MRHYSDKGKMLSDMVSDLKRSLRMTEMRLEKLRARKIKSLETNVILHEPEFDKYAWQYRDVLL